MGATSEWRTAAGLALGPAVALGLARFAYGLLLPGMRDDLGWSYSQAGTINTANALGYLAGALIAARVSRRVGERRAFVGSLAVTAAALLASAASGVFGVLLVLRVVAGVAGAVTFIVGATLAARVGGARDAQRLRRRRRARGRRLGRVRPGAAGRRRARTAGAGAGSRSARWRCSPRRRGTRRAPRPGTGTATAGARPLRGGRGRSPPRWSPTRCSAPATSPT